ncbi:MAG: calcineurin-like phosphoesterase C-terminal domain-containing protein, partial [Bacteroidales bacterium]|nr:calcineurin-like phosphoesterase C-terminal domain-containing protein [Bacteroidales bacterium]
MKRISAIILSWLLPAFILGAAKQRPQVVRGSVTEPDGKPIQGVVVSDGYQVVVTDAQGQYEFQRNPQAYYVYVSIPSEYEVPLRQGHPAFYKKLADDKSYDFVLRPIKKVENNFTMVFMADPQCQKLADVRRLATEGIADLKAYRKKIQGPCYGMTLGDIGYSEGFRNTNYLLPLMREELRAEKTGMPVFQTVGNHDFEYDLAALEEQSPTITLRRNRIYESVFGPVDYSFNRGQVHFVSMNDVCFETFGYPGKYHGDFSDAQVEWLRQDLSHVAKDRLVILCVHIPFEGIWKKTPNVGKVMEMLAAYPNARIMSGHTHTIKHLNHGNGVTEFVAGAMSGCWWWSKNCADGSPNGYAVCRIEGNAIVDEFYKAQNFSEKYQMRIYRGDAQFGGSYEKFTLAHGANTILVNVWNWSEGWRSEVYENGHLAGELELMPTTSEYEAPYNGSKDWWAIGYNVGVVGRGNVPGSNRKNYCSKNYHM